MQVLAPALRNLRAEGYDVVSLSGGEPMLYRDLGELISYAKSLGFRVVAISNGFRINKRFNHLIAPMDGLAISFDGMEDVHNTVRGNARAFDIAVEALKYLREIGKPAAVAYTVSRDSLSDTPEFVEMAAGLGVRAVQLRPLVMAGRAALDYAEPALSVADINRVWLMGEALSAGYRGELFVHTDLAHSQVISADRSAWDNALNNRSGILSDLVNPLVITPNGTLRPFTYDFPQTYDLGHIEMLAAGRMGLIKRRLPEIRTLLADILDDVATRSEFIDWFAHCRDYGRSVAA